MGFLRQQSQIYEHNCIGAKYVSRKKWQKLQNPPAYLERHWLETERKGNQLKGQITSMSKGCLNWNIESTS